MFECILTNLFLGQIQGIPTEGIKVISVLLHAHLTARKLVLRHIRNGKEIGVIAEV